MDFKEHINVNLPSILLKFSSNFKKRNSTDKYIHKDTIEVNENVKTGSTILKVKRKGNTGNE